MADTLPVLRSEGEAFHAYEVAFMIERLRDQTSFLARCDDIAVVYLFGSTARGTSGRRSDVDLAVLFRPGLSDAARAERLLDLRAELATALGRDDLDVIDLEAASPLLRHRVLRDNVVLHCNDESARIQMFVRTLNDYEDTRPLRIAQEASLRTYFGANPHD